MFGVLDRLDRVAFRRKTFAGLARWPAQVAVALEVMRNLHRSEEHRKRAEALMGLALELGSMVHLPDSTTGLCPAQPTWWVRSLQRWRCFRTRVGNRGPA